jgi:hypothetical protein
MRNWTDHQPSLLLLLALASALASAQEPQTPPPPEPATPERPEYRARALPSDTFKPSEQVSEDYAIPFPADI